MLKIRSFKNYHAMPDRFLRRGMLAAGCLLISTVAATAQMFGNEADKPQVVPQIATRPTTSSRPGQQPARALQNRPSPAVQPQQAQQLPAAEPQSEQMEDDEIMPDLSAFQLRFTDKGVEVDLEPKIFLYFRDYRISRNMNGSVNCTMKFFVNSTLPEKISNISYRLKWPKMETALSFDNVSPNMPTYFEYSLLGNGCYDLDKAPNVIVNRCRVKGMSQKQCADAIRWQN